MAPQRKKKNLFAYGGSTLEYMALIIFFITALLLFQRYLQRALFGQWKKAGDAVGHGKQYDPRGFGDDGEGGGTLRCMFVYDHEVDTQAYLDNPHAGQWVLQPCYDNCRTQMAQTHEQCVTLCGKDNELNVDLFCNNAG